MLRSFLLYGFLERKKRVEKFGQGNGCWHVACSSLDMSSKVVSVGVGHDISFELHLYDRFKCKVSILDPTPTGRATISKHRPLPSGLKFLSLGLADRNGEVAFADPANADEGSYRLVTGTVSPVSQLFPCVRLSKLMRDEGLKSIDLLKLDIEGFEYGVIKDLCASRLEVRQICVEFHHGLVPGVSRMDTLSAMLRLRRAGYCLIDHDGLNHTFVRP